MYIYYHSSSLRCKPGHYSTLILKGAFYIALIGQLSIVGGFAGGMQILLFVPYRGILLVVSTDDEVGGI